MIPQLGFEERNLLEKNIVKEGCRDPIVLWDKQILDGHNRYAICTKHGLEYKTANVEIANRNEAINWIIDNQLGKRNLPARVKTYLIGKRYTNEKKAHGGDKKSGEYKEKSSGQNDQLVLTAEKIAEQNKVTEKTVRRNEEFSNSIDTIAEASGESAMDIIAKTKLTQEDVNKVDTMSTAYNPLFYSAIEPKYLTVMVLHLKSNILQSILKNPRKHRDMPQKCIKNGTEKGVNQNPLKIKQLL